MISFCTARKISSESSASSTERANNVVLNSQDSATLMRSLQVLKRGGKLISISGPPDPAFADELGLNWFLKQLMRVLSYRVRKQSKRYGVDFSFLFMRAEGKQLGEITKLIDAGIIKPVDDKVFPFESTNEAMAYVEKGRAKGKVVLKLK